MITFLSLLVLKTSPLLMIIACKNAGGTSVDLKSMTDFFTKTGFETLELPCTDETLNNIDLLISNYNLQHRQSLLFYTGHGVRSDNSQSLYFLTEDHSLIDANNFLKQFPVKTYLWIDACYSGLLQNQLKNSAIYSSLGTETSSSSPLIGAIFTQNILSRLNSSESTVDLNHDRKITFDELQSNIVADTFYYGFDHRLKYDPRRSYVRTPLVTVTQSSLDLLIK